MDLSTEAIQGLSLSLEGIDYIHGCNSLSACVFGVGDRVTNDILQEDLQDTAGFFVDQTRDTLDSTTASQTTNGGLSNSLDIITKDLSMTLGASLSETFSTFSSSGHGSLIVG